MTCRHCRSRLDPTGRCPGDTPLLERDGHRYGTAAQIAHALGPDVTVAMLRNWAARDGLTRYLVGRTVYYRYDESARIEAAKRLAREETGRGRPRRLDAAQVAAA